MKAAAWAWCGAAVLVLLAPCSAGTEATEERGGSLAATISHPLVGAIRWDAWFGASRAPHAGIIGRAVTRALTPSKWHYRLPFFTKVFPNGTILVNGDSSAVMERENKFAAGAGIDYYAFCTYPVGCVDYEPNASACIGAQCCADNYRLSYALERYLRSPGTLGTDKPRFALILQANSWYPVANHGGNETLEQEAQRYAGYFALESYQKVFNDKRPLVFLLGGAPETPQLLEALNLLREKSTDSGLGEPLFIMMANAVTDAQFSTLVNRTKGLGAQGLSQYNSVGNRSVAGWPYANNMAFEKQWWARAMATGLDVVVPVSAGWDSRPRQEHTMPWGDKGNKRCLETFGHECWVEDPTMAQLTEQVKSGLDLNSELGVLLSAWNENDEGHWIVPSLQDGSVKLDAIAKAIGQHRERRNLYWKRFDVQN